MRDDFILNPFNSMKNSDDETFLALVVKKTDEWEEGTLEINSSQLVTVATRK